MWNVCELEMEKAFRLVLLNKTPETRWNTKSSLFLSTLIFVSACHLFHGCCRLFRLATAPFYLLTYETNLLCLRTRPSLKFKQIQACWACLPLVEFRKFIRCYSRSACIIQLRKQFFMDNSLFHFEHFKWSPLSMNFLDYFSPLVPFIPHDV